MAPTQKAASEESAGASAAGASPPASATPPAPEAVSPVTQTEEAVQATLDEPKKKKISILGFQITATEKGAKKALIGAGTLLLVVNGLGLPFILPKLKPFLGAPYVPMKRNVVDVLFDRVLPTWALSRASSQATGSSSLPLSGLRLVDFGSGDGRLVAAAATHGMEATGYELNPYLVALSRLRNRGAFASAPGAGKILWANAWTADLRHVDVVTLYGRPGDGLMERAAAKCAAELPSSAVVVSHFFAMPGWERMLVADIDGLKLYDMSRRDARTPE